MQTSGLVWYVFLFQKQNKQCSRRKKMQGVKKETDARDCRSALQIRSVCSCSSTTKQKVFQIKRVLQEGSLKKRSMCEIADLPCGLV